MDIKTAFLNGFIKEELYMMQPEGFVDPKGANKVCKLQRSIYTDFRRSLYLQESEWEESRT